MPLIVLPKSCSCRCGPCPPPPTDSFVCFLSFFLSLPSHVCWPLSRLDFFSRAQCRAPRASLVENSFSGDVHPTAPPPRRYALPPPPLPRSLARHAAARPPPRPLELDLPTELLERALYRCDPVDIARVAAVSLLFHPSLAVEGIRLWAQVGADCTTSGLNNPNWLEADPKGTLERDDPLGWDTATWTAAPPVDFQSLETQRSPPETRSYGASDYDGNANSAGHAEVHTAGAHVPVGRHETYSIEDVPGTDYDSRHGSRDPGAQWRSVPPPSDDMHGIPDGGALERDQLRLQSQPPLTPCAQGDGAWTGVVTSGRALDTRKPPALVGVHKHEPRRGSASPPQRTAGSEVDAEGLYVDIHGTAYAPERLASRAELERAHRAELAQLRDQIELLREGLETLKRRDRSPNPEPATHGAQPPSTSTANLNGHLGGGGARTARAPPRGRWGPRRKPRAPPTQRASQPAPRGRAASASKRGRVHRR